jgi:hypothetical protein
MKKQVLTFKKLLLLIGVLLMNVATQRIQAQTVYFAENFDSAFTGTPAAPPGWTQTRIQAVTSTANEFDWQQNVWLGTVWSTGITTAPTTGAVTGTGVLWINDYDFALTSTAQSERRIESPSFDLSASTSPYMRFWYFNSEGPGVALNLRVVISTNGGTTWQTLSNVLNGYDSLTNTWNRISVPIPAKFRTTNVKIGFAIVNRYGSGNPFIDAVSVEELTPTVITSAASGNWNSAATWGGIVPTSSHHVVIAHNVTVGTATNIIARCQNLTINSGVTLNFGTTSTNSLHAYGNVTVNGTLSAFNGTLGRIVVVGGNFTIATGGVATFNTGTATQGTTAAPVALTSTSSTLVLTNSAPASFTNSGTLSAGTNRINNIIHLGSDTFTYNNTVFVPFTFALRNGAVNPNGFLTIGNAPSTTTNNTIQRVNGFFTSAPNFNNTNITSRIMAYQLSNTVSVLPEQLTAGFEIEPISGVRTVTGTLVMNTHDNVLVNFPLRIGTATTGGFTLSRGILITTDTIRLTSFLTPPAGTAPSTATPSTTHGSYVVGALRIDMPTSTTTRTFALGVGTQFNQFTPNGNILKNRSIAPGASWSAGTSITMRLLTGATGAVSSPIVTLLGSNLTQVDLNGGPDVPGTTTVTFNGINNYIFGGSVNSDNLFGNENQLYLVQSANITGAWDTASVVSGAATAIANNTNYSRTTNTTISPIATNGGFFTLGTEVGPILYDVTTLNRNTAALTPGTAQSNVQMMRVNIRTTGVIPGINATSFSMSTTGTTNLSNIVNAKVYFTGTDSNFSAINQFGTTFTSPSGRFIINSTRQLLAGNNFFWITYDVPSTASLGDSLAISCDTIIVSGTPYSIAQPAPGFRIYSLPMTYVSSTATHPTLAKIELGSNNNQMLRVRVIMSTTGSPVSASQLNLDVAGSANPLTNIDSISVWYTGANPNFVSPTFYGSSSTQSGPYTVAGALNLLNDTNYFWVTYRVPATATVGDSVDAAIASITIAGTPQTPTTTAPIGSRQIRAPYCPSGATVNADSDIGRVIMVSGADSLMNVGTGCGTAQIWATGTYTNNTTIAGINMRRGSTVNFNICYASSGTAYNSGLAIYIDFNQNGLWDGGEMVYTSPTQISTNFIGSFTVPCNALTGPTRMRIVSIEFTSLTLANACGTFSYGETEDYTINIINTATAFQATTAIQLTGNASASSTNVPVLRVPIKVVQNNCSPSQVTELRFNTIGTTSVADITAAKLYKTGSSASFSTSNLLGTVTSPSGAFSFIINDTAVNDTNNYWLAYDISGTAVNNNVVDARFDSTEVFGAWYTPSISAPAGNVLISTPMTYLGSDAIHPTVSKIERGSLNNQILRVMLRMSSTGAPIQATQLNLSTNGSANPLTNADSIIVWYTGTNPNFISPTVFGSTGPQSAAFVVTGAQNLLNDTNYFWVTYNVPGTATIGDSLDMEISSVTINATVQTPTTTAPIGSRQIRAPYCPSGATANADSDIGRVIMVSGADSLMNVGTGCGTAQIWATGTYTNNTTIAGINMRRGSTVNFNICYASSGTAYNSGLAIYIDFNQNGLWDGGEMVYTSPTQISTNFIGSFTVPCNALTGPTRMRIVSIEFTSLTLANACGTFSYGETEDYTINIINTAAAFQATTAIQLTGSASASSTNVPVLRVPIKVVQNNCSPSQVTELRFNTIGTTSVADITAAKLYKTGSSASFSTSNLLGTVTSPSGAFSFIINDTAVNDTNNYWLAYDISGTAVNNNVVDARFDSTEVFGAWYTPSISAPAGNVLISTPMSYLSSTSVHPTLLKVSTGSTNNQMLRIRVITSPTGAPIPVTQFDLSTNGSVNTSANIDSIIVWYTGANANFSAPVFFGSSGTQSGAYSITGSRNLLNDTNYFWVTYNVRTTANVGDSLDAEVSSITIGGTPATPSVGAPSGSRKIKAQICTPIYTFACTSDDLINNVSTTGGSTNINNLGSGCNGNANNYVYYPNQTVTVVQGGTFTINYQSGANWDQGFKIYIDYNDDGDFTDIGELVANAPSSLNLNTSTITIPLNAELGTLRMRVRCAYGAEPASPCGTEAYGETEDYNVSVLPAPTPTTYVWNQSGAASFAVAANWTPSRTSPNLNDKLVFSSGTSIVVANVPVQTVNVIRVANNTSVLLNTSDVGNLGATDTLSIESGKITTGNNVIIRSGNNRTYINGEIRTGNITGAGYVNGVIQRWVDTVASVYTFPVRYNDTARTVIMDYTAGPSAAGTITVQFVPGNPGNAGLPVTDNFVSLNRASENGVWRINQANGLAGGIYNLSLSGNQFRGILNTSSISVIRRLDNVSNWSNNGTYTAATGTITSPVFNRSGLNVYGEFTAASDTLSNSLPVSLLEFNAKAASNDVLVYWATASEVNNKGFNIERSVDGKTFEFVRFVEGAIQSSSVLNYSEIDNDAFSLGNTLYYRLRQIDLDGTEALSNVAKVTRNDVGSTNVLISPNPFSFNTVVSLSSMEEGNVSITITDIQGRVIATKNVTINQGNNSIILNELEIVSDGVYFIKLSGSATESLKVVKYTN